MDRKLVDRILNESTVAEDEGLEALGFERAGEPSDYSIITQVYSIGDPELHADHLTWPLPRSEWCNKQDHPIGLAIGHAHFFASLETGHPSELTIWNDGRFNWYRSWWSTRRHGGRNTVMAYMQISWRYRDSGHDFKELPTIAERAIYDDKPQPRQEARPARGYFDEVTPATFPYFLHPNVEGLVRITVYHKRT